ncbi:hypothetical protein ABTN21_18880, partial [Acinetobacter baumannii]
DKSIVIAADNDQFKDTNSGVTNAKAAAQAISATVIAPNFTGYSIEGNPTDWNDLANLGGIEEVKKQLNCMNVEVSKSKLKAISLIDFLALEL